MLSNNIPFIQISGFQNIFNFKTTENLQIQSSEHGHHTMTLFILVNSNDKTSVDDKKSVFKGKHLKKTQNTTLFFQQSQESVLFFFLK